MGRVDFDRVRIHLDEDMDILRVEAPRWFTAADLRELIAIMDPIDIAVARVPRKPEEE